MTARLASLLCLALAVAVSGASAGDLSPGAAAKKCRPGFVHAVIAGEHKCLRRGQGCRRSLDRRYHRYGFHCHSGRLTRAEPRRRPPSPPPPGDELGPPGAPGCAPPSPARRFDSLVESRGTSANAELWALFFGGTWASSEAAVFDGAVGREVKIVWRMTGRGDLRLRATGPSGGEVGPKPGSLIRHSSSNWPRPGDEWGSVFSFPEPGCWRIHARREATSADLWVVLR